MKTAIPTGSTPYPVPSRFQVESCRLREGPRPLSRSDGSKLSMMTKAFKLIVLIATLCLLAKPTMAATVEGLVVSKIESRSCTQPPPETSFFVTDIVYLWFVMPSANAGDLVIAKWIDPTNTQVFQSNWPGVPSDGTWCFYHSLILSSGPSPVGSWRVEVYVNGQFMNVTSFEVFEQPPSPLCQGQKINRPSSGIIGANNWTMSYEITDNDGLELRDVSLGKRYMAARMSLPYYSLHTTSFPNLRCELKPDSTDPACRSRLVAFQVLSAPSKPISIEATYEVDRIGGASCLVVTQRYEFHPEQSPGKCEPTVTCRTAG
jgi:hypothetical protein